MKLELTLEEKDLKEIFTGYIKQKFGTQLQIDEMKIPAYKYEVQLEISTMEPEQVPLPAPLSPLAVEEDQISF